MNYLVNPLWIYLINVLTKVNDIASIIVFCGIIAVVFLTFSYCYDLMDGYDKEDDKIKISKTFLKKFAIITIISMIVTTIIPTEKTMYAMLVASNITEENLDTAGQTVTDMVDYIFEKIEELQND